VGGLIGVDVGVLDDTFWRVGRRSAHQSTSLFQGRSEESGARKIEIYVAGAGDFQAVDSLDGGKLRGNFLGDLARGALQALGQFEADWRGDLAHFDARGFRGDDGYVLLIVLADMRGERGADSVYENVYQVAPI